EGVEKSVVIVRCTALDWQELAGDGCRRRGQFDIDAHRVAATREECVDLIGVLRAEDRACRIEQSAPRSEERPQRIEQTSLLQGEARDVALAAQPLPVGMSPDDARG